MRLRVSAFLVLASVAASPATFAWNEGAVLQVADRPPLAAVLRQIGERYPGRALAAHVVEQDDRSLYRIKWLGADGKVRDITCDARTGEILRVH